MSEVLFGREECLVVSRIALGRALGTLTPRQRQAFELFVEYYDHNHPIAQTARELGVCWAGAAQLIRKAKCKLRGQEHGLRGLVGGGCPPPQKTTVYETKLVSSYGNEENFPF